jgi:hypothetical protein
MLIDPRTVATLLLLPFLVSKPSARATENVETNADYPNLQPMIKMKLLTESDGRLLSRVRQVNAATRFQPSTGVGSVSNRPNPVSFSPEPTKAAVFNATLTAQVHVHVLPSTRPPSSLAKRPTIPWHELEVDKSVVGYSKTTESSKERIQSVAASWPRYLLR